MFLICRVILARLLRPLLVPGFLLLFLLMLLVAVLALLIWLDLAVFHTGSSLSKGLYSRKQRCAITQTVKIL